MDWSTPTRHGKCLFVCEKKKNHSLDSKFSFDHMVDDEKKSVAV